MRKTSAVAKTTGPRKTTAAPGSGTPETARRKSAWSKGAGSKTAVSEVAGRRLIAPRLVGRQAAGSKVPDSKSAKPNPLARKAAERKPTPRRHTQPIRTTKPSVAKRKAAASLTPAAPPRGAAAPLDFSKFPPESLTHGERWICLACVWEVFTRHMGLAPRPAIQEIKRYTPSLEELSSQMARPYFIPDDVKSTCPYCGSSSKWHAHMASHRIESGKATDVLRRELLKSLAKSNEQFAVLEQKSTQQEAFFDWLEKISKQLDLDNPGWLREVSLHYLSRKEPKVDWNSEFRRIHSIRRSRRLEEGWEVDGGRLFLAPLLFDELLLVQYLLSRSHRAGGLTLERRYTLPELWHRLRNSGYLRTVGVTAGNPSDALEQLLGYLSGGDASVRFYYIVDRRGFLETAKLLNAAKSKR
jgi:hypothetical protein